MHALPTHLPHLPTDVALPAADMLTRDLPRDQALGLRLIAMARAAAAMHMTEAATGTRVLPGAESGSIAQESQGLRTERQLLRSQAAGLVAAMSRGTQS